MSGLFKGLGDLYSQAPTTKPQQYPETIIIPGQVIDVCMSSLSSLYDSPRDIGKIKFRNLTKETNIPEKEIRNIAYPLDRSMLKYPMPGEEVLIFSLKGEGVVAGTRVLHTVYFYTFVVGALHNITYNAEPLLGSALNKVDPTNFRTNNDTLLNRFEKKIKDIGLVKTISKDIKIYKQLTPYEGDFVLQGRFGNSIRFGSTTNGSAAEWATPAGPSTSGDGIMVLRVDRDFAIKENDMLTTEKVNVDDTSIYLTTTQAVPLKIASNESILKSWAINYTTTKSTTNTDPLGTSLIPQAPLFNPGDSDSSETSIPTDPLTEPNTITTTINVPQLTSASFFQVSNNDLTVGVKTDAGRLGSMGIDQNRNIYSGGSQLILNSDRIIVNSKNDYLMLFGTKGVALSSPGNVNIDAKDDVTIFSDSTLFLGLPGKNITEPNKKQPKNLAQATLDTAYEPLVLGLKLANVLEDLIIILANANILTPIGLGTFREDVKDELAFLKARIPEMLSTYGYIDGITHEAVDPPPPSIHPITTPPTTLIGQTVIPADLLTTTQTPDPFAQPTAIDPTLHPTINLPNYYK